MVMVLVRVADDSSLQMDSWPTLVGLVWGPAAIMHCSTFKR